MGLQYNAGASRPYRAAFSCSRADLNTVCSGNAEKLGELLTGVGFDATGLGLRLGPDIPNEQLEPLLTQSPDAMQEGDTRVKFEIGAYIKRDKVRYLTQEHFTNKSVPRGEPIIGVSCSLVLTTYDKNGTSVEGPIVSRVKGNGMYGKCRNAGQIVPFWQRTLTHILNAYGGDERSVHLSVEGRTYRVPGETLNLRLISPGELDLEWLRSNARGVTESLAVDPDFQKLVAMQESIYGLSQMGEKQSGHTEPSLARLDEIAAAYVAHVPSGVFSDEVQGSMDSVTTTATEFSDALAKVREDVRAEYAAAVQKFVREKVTEESDLARLLRAA